MTMIVKIKPSAIVENKEVKSFYEKQDELINEIRESIRVNGLRNPLVINHENILMDGYLRRDVLLELGKGDEEIEVILVDEESSIDDYIIRNSGRIKTDNDLVNEWKYIFFKKYQKRQGRKKNGELEGTYAENVSRDLGGRFKDDETINKIGFCLKNDLPNNTISKGILKGTVSPVNGYEFLKKFHPIDIKKKYGMTDRIKTGEISVQDAIKLIKQAGGVAVIAHPLASLRGRTVSIDSFKSMVEAGLDGIEISHRDQSEDERNLLREVVAQYDIIATGSSDYHGNGKLNELAEFTTNPEDFEALEARADARRVVRK